MVELANVDLRKIKATVIVTYCGRSGSYFFSNLLDSKSDILSCPPHSLFFLIDHLSELFANSIDPQTNLSPSVLVDFVIDKHPFLFRGASHGSKIGLNAASKMEIGVEVDAFREVAIALLNFHLKQYFQISITDIFSMVHWAYAIAKGRKILTKNPIISWQRHVWIREAAMDLYASNTINPIFLTTIRRFEDAFDAHLWHMNLEFEAASEKPFDSFRHMFQSLLIQFSSNLTKKKLNVPQYFIKFEDLHKNTEGTLTNLCNLFDSNFEPILLQTTLDEQPYLFETEKGKLVTGTNVNLKSRDSFKVLSDDDVIALNFLFYRYYQYYGYELNSRSRKYLRDRRSPIELNDVKSVISQMFRKGKSELLCKLAIMPDDCFSHIMTQAFCGNPLNSIATTN